jgi:hypothetical protein
MRKKDYGMLADLIKKRIEDTDLNSVPFVGTVYGANQSYLSRSFKILAREFASSASVDKAEFLKACGIE